MTRQGEVARPSTHNLIEVVLQFHLLLTDIDIGNLRRIDSSHHDVGRELIAAHDGLRVGNDESLKGVHADILHVDVLHECVQHLAFSIAHVVLQLRQECHGSSSRHRLEHVLLPVLA